MCAAACAEDLGRLARILAGCAIGVTLGGGGARGFAHIGVIRALEEARIPIDMICGVSMGAIIAGQYAMGWDWPTMIRSNKRLLADRRLNTDLALPLFSLSSGRRFRSALKTFFGEIEIEDLWLSYFCTSCNLSSSELVVHRRGRLWWSVNASNAIPGLLPPVLDGGQLLIDGGVLNNQPGDLLKEVCGGPVIVSMVSPRKDLAMDESFTEMPSAWRFLRSRLNPFEKTDQSSRDSGDHDENDVVSPANENPARWNRMRSFVCVRRSIASGWTTGRRSRRSQKSGMSTRGGRFGRGRRTIACQVTSSSISPPP